MESLLIYDEYRHPENDVALYNIRVPSAAKFAYREICEAESPDREPLEFNISLLYNSRDPLSVVLLLPAPADKSGIALWPVSRDLLEEACTAPLDTETDGQVFGEGDVRIIPTEDALCIQFMPYEKTSKLTKVANLTLIRSHVEEFLDITYRSVSFGQEEEEVVDEALDEEVGPTIVDAAALVDSLIAALHSGELERSITPEPSRA